MDSVLKNAEIRLEQLAAEINKKNQEIEELRRQHSRAQAFILDWYAFSGQTPPTQDSVSPQEERSEIRKLRVTGNPKKEEVAAAAREIIAEHGSPVDRATLSQKLAERGFVIEGVDPKKTLSTMMWRMAVPANLTHIRGHGYWFADQPYPTAKDQNEILNK